MRIVCARAIVNFGAGGRTDITRISRSELLALSAYADDLVERRESRRHRDATPAQTPTNQNCRVKIDRERAAYWAWILPTLPIVCA